MAFSITMRGHIGRTAVWPGSSSGLSAAMLDPHGRDQARQFGRCPQDGQRCGPLSQEPEDCDIYARHWRVSRVASPLPALEKDLGYQVQTRIIDSSPRVSQKRERIFLVGFRGPSGFRFDWLALPSGPPPVLGTILERRVDSKYSPTTHLWDYLKA